MGFAGVVGLDYVAVYKIADTLGIKIDQVILRKIQALESETLRMIYNRESKKEKKCRNLDACAMCNKICDERIKS